MRQPPTGRRRAETGGAAGAAASGEHAPPASRSPAWRWLVPVALAAAGLFAAGRAPSGGGVFMAASCAVAVVYTIAWWLWGCPRRTLRAHRLGRDALRGLAWGAGLAAVFAAGALAVRGIPLLAGPVAHLLEHATAGHLLPVAIITALSGIAEELFYRRTALLLLPGRFRTRALVSLGLYMAVSATMGVPLLVFAAAALGAAATAEARRTGSLTSPIVMHLVWSLAMLMALPALLQAV